MKLGLCCISEILKEQGVSFRTITRTSFNTLPRQEAESKLKEIALHNFSVTNKVIQHCLQIGISHYRLSSSLIPLVTCKQTFKDEKLLHWLFLTGEFASLRDTVKDALAQGMTFSSHPGQFVILGSLKPEVVEASIRELNFHGMIHDHLGLPQNHTNPINIHVGCAPNENIDVFIKRYITNVFSCHPSVFNRLTLENEDKSYWCAENLYYHFGEIFPLCYDNLHNATNPSKKCGKYWREIFETTWCGFIPVFHWSEGIDLNKSRHHTEFLTHFPDDYVGYRGTLEVEVKQKDRAILEYLKSIT